ncbi:YciI family protein [Isoptericola sp. NEAU-Y5]|uniref:YciI family protein n=1 Tax=Isoptericola luteus TaxID=2879484 RepID=A0ABS7ZEW4_9MICO|nr:YciI family protein [Isoptericola sp. NEAU-Y5]MCA5893565.1 YciI family protein [Isoptericola sp. NEAU-Y5]
MAVFAVTYVYVSDAARLDDVRPDHRAFLGELHAQGVLHVSGPLPPSPDGAPAGALLVVEAEDVTTALRVLDEDPFRRAGLLADRSAREWVPVIGGFAR